MRKRAMIDLTLKTENQNDRCPNMKYCVYQMLGKHIPSTQERS